ncbi:MAG: hypothetical protein WB711_10595 [Terriglobales bacterium]
MTFGPAAKVEKNYPVPMAFVALCAITMRRIPVAAVLMMVLLGCGGSPKSPVPAAGFINQTRHSDADLQAIWTEAQQSLAQQIDLNPLQQLSNGVSANIRPGDPHALGVEPHQLLVAAEPDVSPEVLFAATGEQRANPTGMIACPQPCNVRYSTAYSFYQPDLTKYAASWEFDGDNFNVILEYEFENHILNALGYNMKWR